MADKPRLLNAFRVETDEGPMIGIANAGGTPFTDQLYADATHPRRMGLASLLTPEEHATITQEIEEDCEPAAKRMDWALRAILSRLQFSRKNNMPAPYPALIEQLCKEGLGEPETAPDEVSSEPATIAPLPPPHPAERYGRALERAIEAEGFRIMVGDGYVTLERRDG